MKGRGILKERFFKFAKEASKKADYRGANTSSPAIGAVAVLKGSIVAEAWNTNKTSPLQAKYNVYRYHNPNLPAKSHCETLLCQRLRWKFGDSLDWSKVDIYLYREYKDGSLAMSRPCKSCIHMLRDEFHIKRVFYTTPEGYVEEEFKGV